MTPDSLRADRLSPWSDDAPPTPNVEALASRGTLYRNAWATAPWTAPSVISIFTGLYPTSHGVAYRDDTTPASLPTLPRLLSRRGYRIGNFTFFSRISYFRNLGLGAPPPGLSHTTVAESFAGWLAGLPPGEPFFAWVHLLHPHLPYGASGYRAAEAAVPGSSGLVEAQLKATVPVGSVRFDPDDRPALLRLYDADVRRMDGALGRALDALEASGRSQDTIVAFVADHGEELLEHGWIGHASTAVEAKLVPEILRVPMILAGPGVAQGRVRDELVQPLDLFPTLLRLLGLEPPSSIDGRPLPGTPGSGWRGGRRFAFFDSSPGGNLTPQRQRGERLQGVGDGECLWAVHSFPERAEETVLARLDDGECSGRRTGLELALARWQASQARRRLALLAADGQAAGAPSSDTVDGFDLDIAFLRPSDGETLSWGQSGGTVTLEWEDAGSGPWLEYRLEGAGLPVRGAFRVTGRRVDFGPIPQGFWNDVAAYSPIRLRLADAERGRRSRWIEVSVEPVTQP